jgi:hypothetical protein
MRRLLVPGLVLAALIVVVAAAAGGPQVTINVRQVVIALPSEPGGIPLRQTIVSGSVANGTAGQTVGVLARECGPANRSSGFRLVGGDETSAGGRWQVVFSPPGFGPGPGSLGLSEYFRARWNNVLSPPVLARGALQPFIRSGFDRRGRAYIRIYVPTHLTGQRMRGKFVELQRRNTATGEWVRAGRARLKSVKGEYLATLSYSLRPRGVTFRVYLPKSSTRPCFDPGWTVPWTT